MSHHSSSVNGEGTSHKDPLSRILDELSSLKEEERRKIMKEMKREKHVSYSSHDSCKSLSEELSDYYRGRHSSHSKHHSQRKEEDRRPQEVNISLLYFHGKDNVKAYLDWETKVEQIFAFHHISEERKVPLATQDKGKTIEKSTPKTSSHERTSNIKCFKCLGRGLIASQCPTKKTMIMRGQDIYSSQEESTSSPSSSGIEDEVRGEESSEEVYPHEERDLVMENHFVTKCDIKRALLLKQSFYLLLSRETSLSTAIPLELEVIPQVKELLDEGLVCKSLTPYALLVPKIGIMRHKIPIISGITNVLSGATLFCKITNASNIFMIHIHRDSFGRFVLIFNFNTNLDAHMGYLRFVILFGRNNQHKNTEKIDQGVPTKPKRIKVISEWPIPPTIRKIWGLP
ncbi:hypothetical protein HKD37_04G010707 [Glycine soja]